MRRFAVLFLCVLCLFAMCVPLSAHPGGTDGKGGHYNHSTGKYHYHHGYSAHQHEDLDGDGIKDCPYDFKDNTDEFDEQIRESNPAFESQPDAGETDQNNRLKWTIALLFALFSASISTALVVFHQRHEYTLYATDTSQQDLRRRIQSIVSPKGEQVSTELNSVHANYAFIDDIIRKETDIDHCFSNAERHYKETTEKLAARTSRAITISGFVHFILMALLLCAVLFPKGWLALLIMTALSCCIVFAIINGRLSDTYEEFNMQSGNDRTAIVHVAKKILYEQLLNHVQDEHVFLGIPNHIVWVDHNPINIQEEDHQPFGSFTRYIAPVKGTCLHKKKYCSNAFEPIHVYAAVYLGKIGKGKRYTPCQMCNRNDDHTDVPDWYVYYLKLDAIREKASVNL